MRCIFCNRKQPRANIFLMIKLMQRFQCFKKGFLRNFLCQLLICHKRQCVEIDILKICAINFLKIQKLPSFTELTCEVQKRYRIFYNENKVVTVMLDKQITQQLIDHLNEELQPAFILLFGSHAKGTAPFL